MTKKTALELQPGTPVFCTVRGRAYGWHTFAAVRPRDGYIKIEGYRPWCPPSNFTLTDPRGFSRADRDQPVVHHIDGDPRNNDPSNLVVMASSERGRPPLSVHEQIAEEPDAWIGGVVQDIDAPEFVGRIRSITLRDGMFSVRTETGVALSVQSDIAVLGAKDGGLAFRPAGVPFPFGFVIWQRDSTAAPSVTERRRSKS